jgi:hypothetical protein
MSTKDLAKDLEETIDEGNFIEFDSSGERKDSEEGSGETIGPYTILHKVKLPSKDDPAVMQLLFRLKSAGLV